MFFSNFCIFMIIYFRIFSYFCTLGELCFLDGGFLDLVVFGFRFWNLKPSYKFLNKSNYPLPLPLRIKIVCPDFTISTHYTSCFTIKITYQGSTNRNVESRPTFSLYPGLSDNFVTKQYQFSIGFIIKSSLLADGPKISYSHFFIKYCQTISVNPWLVCHYPSVDRQ